MANRYEKSENIFKEKFQVPDDMDDDLFEIAAGLPLRNKNRENEPKPVEDEPLPNEEQIELDYC